MRESTETIPAMNGNIVFTDASIDFVGVRYQVGYARITGPVKEFSSLDLVGMMPMFFMSDGLTAREESFDPWNGHPAFFATFEDKGTHIVNRNVLVGDRLYRIMATMPMRAAETERVYVERFFEGFELQAPGGS